MTVNGQVQQPFGEEAPEVMIAQSEGKLDQLCGEENNEYKGCPKTNFRDKAIINFQPPILLFPFEREFHQNPGGAVV